MIYWVVVRTFTCRWCLPVLCLSCSHGDTAAEHEQDAGDHVPDDVSCTSRESTRHLRSKCKYAEHDIQEPFLLLPLYEELYTNFCHGQMEWLMGFSAHSPWNCF